MWMGSESGTPTAYNFDADNIHFGPVPDSEVTVKLGYYGFTPLDGTNTTNWLSDEYPDIYLTACLVEAANYSRDDDQAARLQMKLETMLLELESSDSMDIASSMQMRLG